MVASCRSITVAFLMIVVSKKMSWLLKFVLFGSLALTLSSLIVVLLVGMFWGREQYPILVESRNIGRPKKCKHTLGIMKRRYLLKHISFSELNSQLLKCVCIFCVTPCILSSTWFSESEHIRHFSVHLAVFILNRHSIIWVLNNLTLFNCYFSPNVSLGKLMKLSLVCLGMQVLVTP